MKFLRIAMIAMASLMVTANHAAEKMTPTQEKAQRTFYSFLDKEGFKPEVDTTDNSVCFRNKENILFWVTFGNGSPMCYTLHRKGFKVGDGKEDFKRNPSIIAANEIKATYPDLNITVTDSKVNIVMNTYATTTQDYTKIFKDCFDKFNGVDIAFKRAYEIAYKKEMEDRNRAEQQIQEMVGPSELEDYIAGISFRNLDEDDKILSDYGKSIKAKQAQYIQFLFEFNPWKQESFETTLYIRIIRPDGEMISQPGKTYSMEIPVEVKKSKKTIEWEVPDLFGSTKADFWKPGEYKVEVLDGLTVIYTTDFNLL